MVKLQKIKKLKMEDLSKFNWYYSFEIKSEINNDKIIENLKYLTKISKTRLKKNYEKN